MSVIMDPEQLTELVRDTDGQAVPRDVDQGLADPKDLQCDLQFISALQFLDSVKRTLSLKNQAYGNAALDPLRVFSQASPVEQLLVRIDDKLSRVARGAKLGEAFGEDIILDLCGYLALLHAALYAARGDDAK